MNEITDQAGFIESSGFWNSPIGKQWLKEEQERAKNKPLGTAKAIILDMSKLKIERYESI